MDTDTSMTHANSAITRIMREERTQRMVVARDMLASISPSAAALNDHGGTAAPTSSGDGCQDLLTLVLVQTVCIMGTADALDHQNAAA
jgi:hypothetical protein